MTFAGIMSVVMSRLIVNWEEAARRLRDGEMGVVPTDTVYGIVGLASRPRTVERIYALRRRELDKPLITLIAGTNDLRKFDAQIDQRILNLFKRDWPGPASIIVPVPAMSYHHIHRGTDSIAFRVPSTHAKLHGLISDVGPIVAPSANWAGQAVARTIDEAYDFFGDEVFYVDAGPLESAASALIDSRGERPVILRDAPGFAAHLRDYIAEHA